MSNEDRDMRRSGFEKNSELILGPFAVFLGCSCFSDIDFGEIASFPKLMGGVLLTVLGLYFFLLTTALCNAESFEESSMTRLWGRGGLSEESQAYQPSNRAQSESQNDQNDENSEDYSL
jgi:hypothetical protein